MVDIWADCILEHVGETCAAARVDNYRLAAEAVEDNGIHSEHSLSSDHVHTLLAHVLHTNFEVPDLAAKSL